MREEIDRWGWPRYLHMRLMWDLNRVVGLDLFWITRRKLGPRGDPPDSVRTQLASREVIDPYLQDPSYNLRKRWVVDSFARGDVCVATFVDDRLAAYGWVAYKPVPHAGQIWIDFDSGHRYTTSSFTHPDFRGRHIRGSFGALDALDREHAVTHSLSAINTHNFASLRADARTGAKIVGFAGYFEVFGRVFAFRSPGAKKYGFRFHCPDDSQARVASTT